MILLTKNCFNFLSMQLSILEHVVFELLVSCNDLAKLWLGHYIIDFKVGYLIIIKKYVFITFFLI